MYVIHDIHALVKSIISLHKNTVREEKQFHYTTDCVYNIQVNSIKVNRFLVFILIVL